MSCAVYPARWVFLSLSGKCGLRSESNSRHFQRPDVGIGCVRMELFERSMCSKWNTLPSFLQLFPSDEKGFFLL